MEEAQVIATEYIYSAYSIYNTTATLVCSLPAAALENLPGEVQHLLTEIKLKDERAQELQGDIHLKTQRYIRQAIKNGNGKEPPQGIDDQYALLDTLATDKIRIAQRLVDVLHRACGRLDVDLARILAANGDISDLAGLSSSNLASQQSWAQARVVAEKLRETLRSDPELVLANAPSPLTSASLASAIPVPKSAFVLLQSSVVPFTSHHRRTSSKPDHRTFSLAFRRWYANPLVQRCPIPRSRSQINVGHGTGT
jgi:hypothetical protein